jgi:hypothetical protein
MPGQQHVQAPEPHRKLNRNDKLRQKHQAAVDSFSVKNSGLEKAEIVQNRKVTDVLFSVLLLLCIAVTLVLTLKNLSNDNLQRLLGPISGKNNVCDIGSLKGYPYLYYTDLSSTSLSSIQNSGFCVKECPSLANNLNYQCNEPYCNNATILQNLYPTTAAVNSLC